MTASAELLQRITALTPMAEIVSRLGAAVLPVVAKDVAPLDAAGFTLATDIVAAADLPAEASALFDGWAVAAEAVAGANSYAPVVLKPVPQWVNAGEAMPSGTDAVLPADALTIADGYAEVLAPSAHGEGVLPARGHAAAGAIVCSIGSRIRATDAAILAALNIRAVSVRVPRVKIFSVNVSATGIDAIAPLIAAAVRAQGGVPEIVQRMKLDDLLKQPDCDAVVAIGGTGSGTNDTSVKALARIGSVAVHGFAVSPGQSAALGSTGECPVLLLPGRLDAALAVFIAAGQALLARLTGGAVQEPGIPMRLAKKIASAVGLTDIVFVRSANGVAEPLGNGFFPLHAMVKADGWILIPPASEGLSAGATVEVRPLP
jgi:molybdopterin molybdotransferase